MLTFSPWDYRNDPLSFAEAGARTGLEARGQDLGALEAGQRLRLSYDQLQAEQDARRQAAAQSARALAATYALKQSNQDAMNLYRQQQIQDQQERLKQTADKTTAAADALNAAHEDTAAFLQDAATMGAAKALLKHPNADKTVVDHVMSLEKQKTAPPEKPGTMRYSVPNPLSAKDASGNAANIIYDLPADSPLINSTLGTNAPPGTGTNYMARLGPSGMTAPPSPLASSTPPPDNWYSDDKGTTLLSPPATEKQLDKATASQFLKQANGDKEKARKLARDAGYTF